jgi:hypothetical protein
MDSASAWGKRLLFHQSWISTESAGCWRAPILLFFAAAMETAPAMVLLPQQAFCLGYQKFHNRRSWRAEKLKAQCQIAHNLLEEGLWWPALSK